MNVPLTADEHAAVASAARAEGLTAATYIRRCINSAWIEGGMDDVVLQERGIGPRLRPDELVQMRAWAADGWTVTQISRRTRRPLSTVYRILGPRRNWERK